jgi:uncharacterized membrane protein
MKKQLIINILIVLLALSPIGYLFITWHSIPEMFVTKFEFNKSFEKVQSRETLLTATIILSVVSALLYLLMRNLKKVDPKVDDATPKSSFHKLGLIITLFLVILNYFFVLSTKNEWTISTNITVAFFGLLIALIGNYMNNLKPNYIAGIRLPWTLNDHDNWRRTHRLASKLWFTGGFVLIIISFLLPKTILIPAMIILLVVLVIIPSIYSYKIYRSKLS